jgi:hypothetical protein
VAVSFSKRVIDLSSLSAQIGLLTYSSLYAQSMDFSVSMRGGRLRVTARTLGFRVV